jgi:AraC-like DNA-binding protein
LTREVVATPSRHVQLALVHVPGPSHAIEAQPYLRISFNIGPTFAIDVESGERRFQLRSGRHSLMVIPPDLELRHHAALPRPSGRPYVPVQLATFRISRELLAACAMQLGLSHKDAQIEHQVLPNDEVLRPLAQALLAQLRAECPDGPLAAEQIATTLLSCILVRQVRSGPKATARAIARVKAHIQARLNTPLALDELAAQAQMSRFHFSRVFHAAQGQTPHQYILAQRIDQAKRLLWSAGRGPLVPAPAVLEVALACGFSSASHFSAAFKRLAGMTPQQWQRLRPGSAQAPPRV